MPIDTLREHVVDADAKAYGFRGREVSGVWESHPYGEWAVGTIVGPQPGGRAQFDGLRTTGARVEKGFSGGGVYDSKQRAVVGMIVESDRDVENKIAQFIDVPSLQKALGRVGTGTTRIASLGKEGTTRRSPVTQTRAKMEEINRRESNRLYLAIKKPKRAEREYGNIDRFALVFHNQFVEMMSKDSAIHSNCVPDKADSRALFWEELESFRFLIR